MCVNPKHSDSVHAQRIGRRLLSEDKEFVHEEDYDKNGILYFLGTNFGTEAWRNPAERGLVGLSSSGWNLSGLGSINDMIDRGPTLGFTEEVEGAWVIIDFGQGTSVKPSMYTLSHFMGSRDHCLYKWVLEGSNDGSDWVTLKQHSRDLSLDGLGVSHSWSLDKIEGYFRMFRIRMTGPNSYDHWHLTATSFEVYGVLRLKKN